MRCASRPAVLGFMVAAAACSHRATTGLEGGDAGSSNDAPLVDAGLVDATGPSPYPDYTKCPAGDRIGVSCGVCGGRIECNGQCSRMDPPTLGATCSRCGVLDCQGRCTVADPPNLGATCGASNRPSCGEIVTCDGSCKAFGKLCGPMTTESCCTTGAVPGGEFTQRGALALSSVSPFTLDKFHVTVARFRRFVQAGLGTRQAPPPPGAGAHPKLPTSGWDPAWNQFLEADAKTLMNKLGCTHSESSEPTFFANYEANERRPINCVSWYEALAFCIWDGGRLPTELEYTFAAQGGKAATRFPWGDTLDPTHAVYGCLGDGTPGCGLYDLMPVGSRPDGNSLWGHADLVGNVREWVLDTPPPASEARGACHDCVELRAPAQRITKGATFRIPGNDGILEAMLTQPLPPSARAEALGFRCVRD